MGTVSGPPPLVGSSSKAVKWRKLGRRCKIDAELSPLLDLKVYRYCTIAEALLLIRHGQLAFAKPKTWTDVYEKHVSQELFQPGAMFESFDGYVKCVSFEFSSEAMWRFYASASGGLVRLSWTLRQLLLALDAAEWGDDGKIYAGRVRYQAAPAIRTMVRKTRTGDPKLVSSVAMQALLMKRAGFSFENEIRIAFFPSVRRRGDKPWTVSGVSTNEVHELLIDPYLTNWQAQELVGLFKDVLKVSFPVGQSLFGSVFDSGPM